MSERKVDIIVQGDCIANMKKMDDQSVDLVFADPPYAMQLGGELVRPDNSRVDAVDDEWDQFDSVEAYDNFTEAWLREAKRVMKDNATLWVMGSYHNIFRVGKILQDLGFWVLNDVLWIKNNPMPNFKGTRFTNAHETLIWAAKSSKSKYTFNYEAMKTMNDDTQMRSDWYLPICSGGERLKDEKGEKLHSTQKPEALLYRVLLASSNKGDLVLDPFSGSGTTAAVAKKLGRHYIGLEQDAKYVKFSRERLDEIDPAADELLEVSSKKKEARIPFGQLLASGLLQPGTKLFDEKHKYEAVVRADGSLKTKDGKAGSIHKLGAELQNAPSCNGWKYWMVEQDGEKKSIDDLRSKVRDSIKVA